MKQTILYSTILSSNQETKQEMNFSTNIGKQNQISYRPLIFFLSLTKKKVVVFGNQRQKTKVSIYLSIY